MPRRRRRLARLPVRRRRPKTTPTAAQEPLRVRPGGVFRPHHLDLDAVRVVRRLNAFGYEAYFVGGCVRDLLLGLSPKDFDIATSATPRQVKRLFRNSRIIGRRFRLVHVTFGDKVLDVSTFRALAEATEGEDDPMIRQDNVFGSAGEDARRRDFTINGLFYDVRSGEVIDFVGGLRDLERRTMETIGEPALRFREDPVRMLRAIKFAGRLGFRLADDVYQAILDCAGDIEKAAPPRVFEEIIRILNRGGAMPSVRLLLKTGLMDLLLPELAPIFAHEDLEARAHTIYRGFAEVDRLVRSGEEVSHHVMLGLLFLPLLEPWIYGQRDGGPLMPPGQLADRLEDFLRPLSQRLRMSRRDVYFLKQIYVGQRRLMAGGDVGRKRKGARRGMPPREWLHDAARLFAIYARETGRFADSIPT